MDDTPNSDPKPDALPARGLDLQGPEPNPEAVERATRRRFSASYKIRIIEEAAACQKQCELGALLRKEGLYSSHRLACRKQLKSHGDGGAGGDIMIVQSMRSCYLRRKAAPHSLKVNHFDGRAGTHATLNTALPHSSMAFAMIQDDPELPNCFNGAGADGDKGEEGDFDTGTWPGKVGDPACCCMEGIGGTETIGSGYGGTGQPATGSDDFGGWGGLGGLGGRNGDPNATPGTGGYSHDSTFNHCLWNRRESGNSTRGEDGERIGAGCS